jgi:hypothetical protein
VTRDEGRGTRDEGRGTRDEGRGQKLSSTEVAVFLVILIKLLKICDSEEISLRGCRVASLY